MKVFITITDPHGNQNIYQVGSKPRVIGRSEKSEIRVSDELASGSHCQVFINDKLELIVEDLRSKNGTSFNGIKKLKHTVYVGDEIHFGSSKLSINTQKSDADSIEHLTFKGDPLKRNSKEVTLELEVVNNIRKTPSKSTKKASGKSISKMSAEERSQYQLDKMYGKAHNKNQADYEQVSKIKYFIADFIDFLIPILIVVASFLLMVYLDPKTLEYFLKLNIEKILNIEVISYPLIGTLAALLIHKLNRNNKGGSIGERVLGVN